jgi:DNA-directed RNA polymerase subunit omega
MESKYALVILAAKRARQIKDGARRLTDSRSANPITAAMEEIAEGAIIARVVEDPTVAASKAALKPNVPSLEDIIGAGPVLAIEPEVDSTAAQLAALRSAEPDSDDEDLSEDDAEETLRPVDSFALDAPDLMTTIDEDDDLIPELDEDEE